MYFAVTACGNIWIRVFFYKYLLYSISYNTIFTEVHFQEECILLWQNIYTIYRCVMILLSCFGFGN